MIKMHVMTEESKAIPMKCCFDLIPSGGGEAGGWRDFGCGLLREYSGSIERTSSRYCQYCSVSRYEKSGEACEMSEVDLFVSTMGSLK
ncbi:hypothetical protein SUGI_0772350 [Cryptomeria japonica]|nr:hypothetical protein SUGI_0772350 [Cryptomeria japonica]